MTGAVFGEGWLVTSVAPRTVNDVSYAMRTKHVSLSV